MPETSYAAQGCLRRTDRFQCVALAAALVTSLGCAQGPADAAPAGVAITRHRGAVDPRAAACLGDSTPTTVTRDYEPHASVDPNNPLRMIAAWMTSGRPGGTVSVAASTNGGATW